MSKSKTHKPLARRTVAEKLTFEGAGIHTGAPCRLEIHPAEANAGITFEQAGADWPSLPATIEHAVAEECDRRTVLRGPQKQLFQQLEHVMAALAAMEITDARVIQNGPEPPFLDGGSKKYMKGLTKTGSTKLKAEVAPFVIDKPIAVTDGDAELVATPHDGLRLSCFVEFPGTVVGSMGFSLEITPESFLKEAAPARTFALERDIEGLKQAGLAKGGNLDNAVVFNGERYLNDRLNFPDEVVRHKVIDLLGDLALIGRPLRGHFWAWRAGHRSHIRFAQALAKELNRDA
ncbi:UDP-3-O-acyl-N-acetylglucosamine deacetylase [bacterium]|nr:UDP-3-O-acyl-N-acetylglucosamine deacetylase [bacterium]